LLKASLENLRLLDVALLKKSFDGTPGLRRRRNETEPTITTEHTTVGEFGVAPVVVGRIERDYVIS
jgi:hypothetical protein